MDPLAIVTLISSGLKLIDQFSELATRFFGKKVEPSKGKAEQVGTALEVRYDNQLINKIDASELKMDQWDNERYKALNKRLQTNWMIYNDLFASEAGASAQEGARIRADIQNTQQTLCRDFKEVVQLYERALGIRLPDHYQLYDIC